MKWVTPMTCEMTRITKSKVKHSTTEKSIGKTKYITVKKGNSKYVIWEKKAGKTWKSWQVYLPLAWSCENVSSSCSRVTAWWACISSRFRCAASFWEVSACRASSLSSLAALFFSLLAWITLGSLRFWTCKAFSLQCQDAYSHLRPA